MIMKKFDTALKAYFIIISLIFAFIANAQVSVLMQHNNLRRTGWNANETTLTQANVSGGNFGKIFSRTVDDQIYAQPLVVSNLNINGNNHNVVFVATVNNSLYAFDAESDTANTPLWQVNLTFPGYRAVVNTDMTGCNNYHDFSGKIGIVGTPAIDTVGKLLYVVARSVSVTGTKTFVQYLHKIDLLTGAEKPGSPVFITATVNGTGDGSVGGKITFDQQRQNQRPGLLLYKGIVYIAWASHCDWSPYHGWILGYNAKTLKLKYTYISTPNGGLGGIWMSGQAPAVDDKGFIYVSTGNGTVGTAGNPNDTINRGESIIKLSIASGKLKVTDFFTPKDYVHMEENDLDYGVDGALLLPNTNLAVSGSKQGLIYLTNNDNMGGYTADNSSALQVMSVSPDSLHVHGTPAYFKNFDGQEYIYSWAEQSLLNQIPFNRSTNRFDTANTIKGTTKLPTGMPGGFFAVSSNGLKKGTGILWATHPIARDGNPLIPGILQAFDPGNVTRELWNSQNNPGRDSVGRFAKFVCPTVANGKVYIASFSGRLQVYGILPTGVAENNITKNTTGQSNRENSFNVLPNPARKQVTIKYNSDFSQHLRITLINNFGQQVYQTTAGIVSGNNTFTIEFPALLQAGIYILQVVNEQGIVNSAKLEIEVE
jgi:hypothetical protein